MVRAARIVASAVLAGALLLGSVATAGADPVAAGGGQFAYADWIVMTSKTHGVFYLAVAVRGPFTDGVQNAAFVGTGTCTRSSHRRFTLIVCRAHPKSHPLALGEFDMDPAMSNAQLAYGSGRDAVRVSWTGADDDPELATIAGAGGPTPGVGAGVFADRWSDATALIAARKLDRHTGMFPFAFLSEEVAAGAQVSDGTTSARIARDGSVVATVRMPSR